MWFASKLFFMVMCSSLFVLGAFLFFYSADTGSIFAHGASKATGISKDLAYAMQAIGISLMVIPGLFILSIADHFVKREV